MEGVGTLTSHWKGFSPVWVLMCSSSPRFWLKALLHSLHLYGFSCSDPDRHTHTHTYRWNLKKALHLLICSRTIHKTLLPHFVHIWTKPGGENESIPKCTHKCNDTHMCARTNTHREKQTEAHIILENRRQCGDIPVKHTRALVHAHILSLHTPALSL